MEKKAYLLTFGCQMNEYDSEVLESILSANGYLMTSKPEEAGLIIVNTCSVRQKAEERAMGRISELAAQKKVNRSLKIVVAGCMAKRAGQAIIEQIPAVDYVVGSDQIPDIPDIVKDSSGQRVFISDKPDNEPPLPISKTRGPTAYLAISRGCENYCSYCIVPYVRGAFRSRPMIRILDQVKALISAGVKDIMLLGQNVNSYRDGEVDFPGLLKYLATAGPPRLRFLTSHPKDISDDLIACFAELPYLCHSLHLPIQSGSDKILALMNRGYTYKHYRERIAKLRQVAPDMTISTDLIVGFPGETEDDFQQTLEAIGSIKFDSAFMFRYSVRPGTAAASMTDDVPESTKIERLSKLIAIQQKISEMQNSRWIGQSLEILIEGQSRRLPAMPKGKTRGGQSVLVTNKPELAMGDLIIGQIADSRAKTLFAAFEKFA
jgi:tRNA-2-methylthio-N6-dimethylallyladenosine synthase